MLSNHLIAIYSINIVYNGNWERLVPLFKNSNGHLEQLIYCFMQLNYQFMLLGFYSIYILIGLIIHAYFKAIFLQIWIKSKWNRLELPSDKKVRFYKFLKWLLNLECIRSTQEFLWDATVRVSYFILLLVSNESRCFNFSKVNSLVSHAYCMPVKEDYCWFLLSQMTSLVLKYWSWPQTLTMKWFGGSV